MGNKLNKSREQEVIEYGEDALEVEERNALKEETTLSGDKDSITSKCVHSKSQSHQANEKTQEKDKYRKAVSKSYCSRRPQTENVTEHICKDFYKTINIQNIKDHHCRKTITEEKNLPLDKCLQNTESIQLIREEKRKFQIRGSIQTHGEKIRSQIISRIKTEIKIICQTNRMEVLCPEAKIELTTLVLIYEQNHRPFRRASAIHVYLEITFQILLSIQTHGEKIRSQIITRIKTEIKIICQTNRMEVLCLEGKIELTTVVLVYEQNRHPFWRASAIHVYLEITWVEEIIFKRSKAQTLALVKEVNFKDEKFNYRASSGTREIFWFHTTPQEDTDISSNYESCNTSVEEKIENGVMCSRNISVNINKVQILESIQTHDEKIRSQIITRIKAEIKICQTNRMEVLCLEGKIDLTTVVLVYEQNRHPFWRASAIHAYLEITWVVEIYDDPEIIFKRSMVQTLALVKQVNFKDEKFNYRASSGTKELFWFYTTAQEDTDISCNYESCNTSGEEKIENGVMCSRNISVNINKEMQSSSSSVRNIFGSNKDIAPKGCDYYIKDEIPTRSKQKPNINYNSKKYKETKRKSKVKNKVHKGNKKCSQTTIQTKNRKTRYGGKTAKCCPTPKAKQCIKFKAYQSCSNSIENEIAGGIKDRRNTGIKTKRETQDSIFALRNVTESEKFDTIKRCTKYTKKDIADGVGFKQTMDNKKKNVQKESVEGRTRQSKTTDLKESESQRSSEKITRQRTWKNITEKRRKYNQECGGMFYLSLFIFVVMFCISGNDARYCKASVDSISRVSHCPRNHTELMERIRNKNCESIEQNCTNKHLFKYHCTVDGFGKNIVEVCAKQHHIVGHFCSEFNTKGGRIQANFRKPCKNCPVVYNSTESPKYVECFANVSKTWSGKVEQNQIITTQAIGRDGTTSEKVETSNTANTTEAILSNRTTLKNVETSNSANSVFGRIILIVLTVLVLISFLGIRIFVIHRFLKKDEETPQSVDDRERNEKLLSSKQEEKQTSNTTKNKDSGKEVSLVTLTINE